MTFSRAWRGAVILCVLATRPATAAPPAGNAFLGVATKDGWVRGLPKLSQQIEIASDVTSFGLDYTIALSKDKRKCSSEHWSWSIKCVTLGMPSPIRANWYSTGFLKIRLDGLSLHDLPTRFELVRSGGPDAMAAGTWHTPKGDLTLRLLMRSDDDKLFMQLTLAPDAAVERLELDLLSYPQGFEKPHNRRAFTAARDVAAPAGIKLGPDREPWALYYDDSRGVPRAGGPCGMVYVPSETESVHVQAGSYQNLTMLKSRPKGRRLTVALWDFSFLPDRDANKAYLREGGEMIAADVAEVAAADWDAPVRVPVRIPASRRRAYAELDRLRLGGTPFDNMTTEVSTPHIKWAAALPGGPVKTLVVAPRWMQRETAELAQRVELAYETIGFCQPDRIVSGGDLYCYNNYDLYGYPRVGPATVLKRLDARLESELDCLILSSFQPRLLPPRIRQRVVDKVRAGTGLLLLGDARPLLKEFGSSVKAVEADSAGGFAGALLPKQGDGKRLWDAYAAGQGRILILNYETGGGWKRTCLSPRLTEDDPDILHHYDYVLGLVGKALLWAARRKLPVRLELGAQGAVVSSGRPLAGAVLEVLADDPARAWRRSARVPVECPQGTSTHTLPAVTLPAGGGYLSAWVKRNGMTLGWASTHVERRPGRPAIEGIDLDRQKLAPGEPVRGVVRLRDAPAAAQIEIEVRDVAGRVLARQRSIMAGKATRFVCELRQPIYVLHHALARLLVDGRTQDQCLAEFTVVDRRVDDFHFVVWHDGANDAVAHGISRVLAQYGVDWLDNVYLCGAPPKRVAAYVRNAARHGLHSIPYITRIASSQASGRVRQPCLTNPEHLKRWCTRLRDQARAAAPYGPPAYTLGDENYLVMTRLDLCTSPSCLAGFRAFLRESYTTLGSLNASWQTQFDAWSEIVPATLDEVKSEPGHWPRWADHREFMTRVFTGAHAKGREAVRAGDPGARVGWDGVYGLGAWVGYDFYQLCRACDLNQVYIRSLCQVEYVRSWHRPDAVTGVWHNSAGNTDEVSAKRVAWHALFHGLNSGWYWTSFFVGPAALFPDLRATPQLKWMAESHREIRSGIGKLLLHAQREHDRIALHYIQSNVYAGELVGRSIGAAHWGCARLVEDLGLQYNWLSSEQIESGALDGYRVLFMPACTALSAQESAAARRFVQAGGTVVADTLPGMLDEHCCLLDCGQLDDLFGVKRSGVRKAPGRKTVRVKHAGADLDWPLPVYDAGLRPAGAEVRGDAEGIPCVMVRDAGKGSAVLLNTLFDTYEDLHLKGAGDSVRLVLREVLEAAEVRPQVRLTHGPENRDVEGCEIVRFSGPGDTPIRYVCVVMDDDVIGATARDVTVALPQEGYVHDVRSGDAHGQCCAVQKRLLPGVPLVLAVLPYPVAAVRAELAAATVRGCEVRCRVHLDTSAGVRLGQHCLRVDLLTPDGVVLDHYGQNILTRSAATEVRIALALNDPPGRWQIRVRDVATGRSSTADFTVTE